MQESTLWSVGTVAGLAVLGAAIAGAVYASPPAFVRTAVGAEVLMGGLLFFVLFLAPGLAMQLYRRGHAYSTFVGGLGAWAFTLAFFGVVFALSYVQSPGRVDGQAALLLVGIAPIIVGALSAGGTLFLARGVKRYRKEHGLVHAPAQR